MRTDLLCRAPARLLVAEGLGTGLLVLGVIGSSLMAASLTADRGVALLANAAATGAMLYVLVSLFGPLSGAQLNPVVTLVLALRRELDAGTAAALGASQVLGGGLGAVAAHLMFGAPALALSPIVRTGPAQWLAEAIATFGLLLAILVGRVVARERVAALVACYIAGAYWFTASTSFANPAVTLARVLTASPAGIRPLDAPAFILAQLAGGLAAAALSGWLLRR